MAPRSFHAAGVRVRSLKPSILGRDEVAGIGEGCHHILGGDAWAAILAS